jgi:acetyl-CoA carboxylase biotin carboxyl carrier protein
MIGDSEGIVARLRREGDRIALCSPGVGLWRDVPAKGTLVTAGAVLGHLEVLGRLQVLVAPEGSHGLVVSTGGDAGRARRPVGYDDVLVWLDPQMVAAVAAEPSQSEAGAGAGGALVFASPSHGRFYAKPAPDKAAFVRDGEVIERGHTVALLEVMKTFNRIQYGGSGLPERARVVRVVPKDGDDLAAGDAILELEPA